MEQKIESATDYRARSEFTGSLLGLIGVNIGTYLLSFVTFGLAYPWLLCWHERWYTEHTYINGRQLYFDGKGMQLIGNWIKWMLLSLITFGIYSWWIPIRLKKWTVMHTGFVDERHMKFYDEEQESPFAEWVTKAAATVIDTSKNLWEKLNQWIQEKRDSRSISSNGRYIEHNGMDGEAGNGSSIWECRPCGHRNPDYAMYCLLCGKKRDLQNERTVRIGEPKHRCPACNAVVQPNSKFCGACGHPIQE